MPSRGFGRALEGFLGELDATAREKVEPYMSRFRQADSLEKDSVSTLAKRTQKFLQKFLDDSIWRRLQAQAFAKDRDRLEAVRRTHAGARLAAFPCQALGLKMPLAELINRNQETT